jgi:endonuclease/exonuclease/phosphatase family metal-dependent hydrolase
VFVNADVQIGEELLHVSALHFESDVLDDPIREAQAKEVAAYWADEDGPRLVGGDLNCGVYTVDVNFGNPADPNDVTVGAFVDAGWTDLHLELPSAQRPTRPPLVLDLLLAKDIVSTDPSLCAVADCPYSDHSPVWTTVQLGG